ncbi:MAG: SixA phosphatase family protein [Phycisphaerales bacterium]
MKRTLLILRHGKSSWADTGLSDHDRPLKLRGKMDAPRMAMLMQSEEIIPDRILSSTAVRARRTAELVASVFGRDATDVELVASLYLAEPEEIVQLLGSLPDDCERPLIVGHNPGLEDLVESLTGARRRMTTAALARVDLELDKWSDLEANPTKTMDSKVWRPSELDDLPEITRRP